MKPTVLAREAEALRSSGLLWLVHLTTGELVPRDLAQYAAMGADALHAYHAPFFRFASAEAFANGIRKRS